MSATTELPGPLRRVRIWLGELLIAEYVADRERATRYRRVMAPRFTGLRITVEPLPAAGVGPADPADSADPARPLPAAKLPNEQLWPLTVQ